MKIFVLGALKCQVEHTSLFAIRMVRVSDTYTVYF